MLGRPRGPCGGRRYPVHHAGFPGVGHHKLHPRRPSVDAGGDLRPAQVVGPPSGSARTPSTGGRPTSRWAARASRRLWRQEPPQVTTRLVGRPESSWWERYQAGKPVHPVRQRQQRCHAGVRGQGGPGCSWRRDCVLRGCSGVLRSCESRILSSLLRWRQRYSRCSKVQQHLLRERRGDPASGPGQVRRPLQVCWP